MKAKDSDIIFIPGLGGAGPDHWQSRWEKRLSTARRIRQAEPDRPPATEAVSEAVNEATKPVVLVAHSFGVAAAVQAIPQMRKSVIGAFFVAPPDLEREDGIAAETKRLAPYPRGPLPFPSIVVASRNDRDCAFERAEEIAGDWGSLLIDAGQSGQLNAASGHGPWPEGSLVFARFVSRLSA